MFFEGCLLCSPITFLGPLSLLLKMVICLPPFILCYAYVALTRFEVSKVKGRATRAMVDSGDFRLEDLVR